MYDALVLAGGSARRLGGRAKPSLVVGGTSLLDRVLDACRGAASTVVVGPAVPTSRPVSWCREDPPGSGPVAALAAGLQHVTAPVVVLLAADLPHLTAEDVAELVSAAPALLVDDDGRSQWLCSAWVAEDLRRALDGAPVEGAALGRVLSVVPAEALHLTRRPAPWTDVDTPEDLEEACRTT